MQQQQSHEEKEQNEQVLRPSPEQMEQLKIQHARMKQEEQDRPDIFAQRLSCNDILRSAHAVREMRVRGEPLEHIRERHIAFAAQFPVIFERCCTPDFPLTMLPVLLSQLRAMQENALSKESATDAVCNALNQKYVDPVLKDLRGATPP